VQRIIVAVRSGDIETLRDALRADPGLPIRDGLPASTAHADPTIPSRCSASP